MMLQARRLRQALKCEALELDGQDVRMSIHQAWHVFFHGLRLRVRLKQ